MATPSTGLHFVITGASRGIGFELASQALAAGHRVTAIVRSPHQAESLKRLGAEVLAGDVTSKKDFEEAARKINAPIDVLINNAGIFLSDSRGEVERDDEGEKFENLDTQHLAKTFDVNTLGPIRVTQALLPLLQKSKNPKVIQITSLMGSIADNTSGGCYGYRMSKAALNMFNKCLANDFPGLIAIVMHPGWVKTDMGGERAPTSPQESAQGIHRVIARLERKESGQFFDFEGDALPW